MKRFGFGVLWFLALTMGALIIGGMVVGAMAGSGNPADAAAAGQAAGQEFGEKYAGMIFLGALIVAVVGSILGWLPGTKSKNQ